jgi:hypothetical protein
MPKLVTPLFVDNTNPIQAVRTNIVTTSKVHGTFAWVSVGVIGVALIVMVVFLMKYKRHRNVPRTILGSQVTTLSQK